MPAKRGEIVYRNTVSWTLNEDAAKTLDLTTAIGGRPGESYILSVRNGSATVDLTVAAGSKVQCYPSAWLVGGVPVAAKACAMADAGDVVTCAAHGLAVGDAVVFGATTGGVTVGTIYYIVTTATANTFQFSTARAGGAFNITADGANTVNIATEFMQMAHPVTANGAMTMTVPKFAAASSTAPVAGLVETILPGFPWGLTRLMFIKSATNAAAFSAYVEIRRG